MSETVAIRFTQPHTPYQKGEVAGFRPDQANFMVDRLRVAERVAPVARPAPSPAPPSPTPAAAPPLEQMAVTRPAKAGVVNKSR